MTSDQIGRAYTALPRSLTGHKLDLGELVNRGGEKRGQDWKREKGQRGGGERGRRQNVLENEGAVKNNDIIHVLSPVLTMVSWTRGSKNGVAGQNCCVDC